MSNVDRKKKKHSTPAAGRKLGWVVPAKRQPLFPTPTNLQSAASAQGSTQATQGSTVASKRQHRTENRQSNTRANSLTYFASAKRSIVSLYFVLPLILAYEIAKISAGVEQLSSGVDLWIHNLLCVFGAGQLVILPLLTTAVLLYHHHQNIEQNKNNWHIKPSTIPKMAGEAIGFGLMLFFFANIFQIAAVASPTAGKLVDPYYWQIGSAQWWSNVITYVGTGIHEELIFRVILMLPLIKLLKDTFADKQTATLCAVIAIGLTFSLAHVDIINPLGDPFNTISFTFRFIASCIFSAIFLYRGFGIVVGTHIVYDILTLIA